MAKSDESIIGTMEKPEGDMRFFWPHWTVEHDMEKAVWFYVHEFVEVLAGIGPYCGNCLHQVAKRLADDLPDGVFQYIASTRHDMLRSIEELGVVCDNPPIKQ